MKSHEIRSKFLEFFKKRGHAIIPSASLVTTDEKGVTNPTLFNTAGMQPLIPFLLGEKHPLGKRLADSQKCLRTVDIDDIGDKTHATFFEMLGNWSLGDYFKKDAIQWSYEFLTSKEEGLGLDPSRLYVTVFEGDDNAPRDNEAEKIWKDVFEKNNITGSRIFFMPASSNWWEAGENGPCGPDTEMYYDIKNKFAGKGITKEEFIDADSKRDVVEIWNDVFMQYEKKDGKIIGGLPAPSVDTGAGLERLTMTLQGVDNIYDTDLFSSVMSKISEISGKSFTDKELKSARIIADHIRASSFLIADGVVPSNTDRGYVLRKLIRRAVRNAQILSIDENSKYSEIINLYANFYKDIYPELLLNLNKIIDNVGKESDKFRKSLTSAMKVFDSYAVLSVGGLKEKILNADKVFELITTYGLTRDIIDDEAKNLNLTIFWDQVDNLMKKHQELSRSGAEQKFKGGLADANNEMVVRYHTATHLLHQALFDVLGDGVMQKGSNITPERLRFDFAYGAKMTDEQKKRVEDIVNEKINQKLPMNNVVMPREQAEKTGAKHFFGEKYGEQISIYFIGNDLSSAYSKEFCGGPHVKNTSELAGPEGKWQFKIQKEEAVSAGVRRIKAVLV